MPSTVTTIAAETIYYSLIPRLFAETGNKTHEFLLYTLCSYSKPIPFEEHWNWNELARATRIYIEMVWYRDCFCRVEFDIVMTCILPGVFTEPSEMSLASSVPRPPLFFVLQFAFSIIRTQKRKSALGARLKCHFIRRLCQPIRCACTNHSLGVCSCLLPGSGISCN